MSQTDIRLFGRTPDKPGVELGVAMDNLTDTLAFYFQMEENPYIADENCVAYLKTNTLHVPVKLPLEISRTEAEAVARATLASSTIPFGGRFTGQIQLELPAGGSGGFFVWQSEVFELFVHDTLDADKAIDSQLSGAYDQLFRFEQAEAVRALAETERETAEAARRETMTRLQTSLDNTVELIERIEGTLEADQLGIGIASAAVNLDTGHLLVTLTSGREIDAGRVAGPKGDKGDAGDEVELAVGDGYINWRYASENGYRPLISLSALAGTDGREVSLRVDSGQVQWRLGEGGWNGLIDLDDLKGADGASFVIRGLYATLAELEAAYPAGAGGDAYAVGTAQSNTTYLWDVDRGAWTDVGSIKGDKGDAMNFESLTQAQKDELCRFTDAYREKLDSLAGRVDQDVTAAASPSFEAVSAKTITADRVVGAVYA